MSTAGIPSPGRDEPTAANDPDRRSPDASPPAGALDAYRAYQETMRQFLAVQEQVMTRFLDAGDAERRAALPAAAVVAPRGAVTMAAEAVTPATAPAAAPPPEPSAEEVVPLARSELLRLVQTVVSDCTGYPPDMLGVDQGLESDLGIDSIKRVEIIAAVEKALPAPLASAIRGDRDSLARAGTLSAIADVVLRHADAGAVKALPAMAAAPLDRSRLRAMLVEVVSDCTGYPPDMLGVDQGLESELGIDSIKRLEILAGIERRLPAAAGKAMRADMERFIRAPTLDALTDALLGLLGPDSADPEPDPAEQQPPFASADQAVRIPRPDTSTIADASIDTGAAMGTVRRYLMRAMPAPLPPTASSHLDGLVLVTPDTLGVAPALAAALQDQGIESALLPAEALDGAEAMARALAEVRKRGRPVVRVAHLAGIGTGGMPAELAQWRQATGHQVKSLLHLLQDCADDLRGRRGQVLAVSMLGGAFGRNGVCGPGLPAAASTSGLLKTLHLEWPEVRVRALDVDAATVPDLPARLVEELLAPDDDEEVGYCAGVRAVHRLVPAPLNTVTSVQPVHPAADWVVLALGGARGITAEVLRDLMLPGMTLVLLGRSPQHHPEPAAARGIDDEDRLRQVLIDAARQSGEIVKPAEIDRRIRQLRRQREIQSNLEAFAAAGARVEYHAVDVTSNNGLAAIVEDVYGRFGRIDALLQGIGIIEDKLLLDKSATSFDRVFDTKVDSTYLLSQYLRPDSLKLALLFASVAGRTGNRGQCDYASANEALNRLAWWMRGQWSNTRVLSINWGPWDVTGMATEAVNRQFRERGIVPILPAAGCRFLRDELAHGDDGAVEIVAGIFDEAATAGAGVANAGGSGRSSAEAARQPLLPEPAERRADGSVEMRYRFALDQALYLDHHRLDGVAVVPAAVAMELLAELVQSAWPDFCVVEVRDLRVLHGLTLPGDRDREVLLQAELAGPADGDSDGLTVTAMIRDADSGRPCYRCRVLLGPGASARGLAEAAAASPLDAGRAVAVPAVYAEHCFHGPRLQLLSSLRRIGGHGVDGELIASDPRDWSATAAPGVHWLFDPGIVDAMLQGLIVWARLERDTYPLPAGFRRVRRAGDVAPGTRLSFTMRVRDYSSTMVTVDLRAQDADRRAVLTIEGMEAGHSRELLRLAPTVTAVAAAG